MAESTKSPRAVLAPDLVAASLTVRNLSDRWYAVVGKQVAHVTIRYGLEYAMDRDTAASDRHLGEGYAAELEARHLIDQWLTEARARREGGDGRGTEAAGR